MKRTSCNNSKESEYQSSVSKLNITLNEPIMQDREKLIKYIKIYVQNNNKIPPTTLDFYKIVKLIGKGAFGKVTLGIHKLTGKHVAIKNDRKIVYEGWVFKKKSIPRGIYSKEN